MERQSSRLKKLERVKRSRSGINGSYNRESMNGERNTPQPLLSRTEQGGHRTPVHVCQFHTEHSADRRTDIPIFNHSQISADGKIWTAEEKKSPRSVIP
jgi:hypothetical protein